MSSDETQVAESDQKMSLKVNIEDTGACKRHIAVTVSEADISEIRSEALNELAEKAEVPGFRVGKVPAALLLKRFRTEIASDIKQKVLLASLDQISEEYNIDPIGEPRLNLENLEVPDSGEFHYEFDVEVRPTFDLPDFSSITIRRPSNEVTDEDLALVRQNFLMSRAARVATTEAAAAGDYVVCDISCSWQGREIQEFEAESVRVLPVLNFPDAAVDKFDELMSGARPGDKRETTTRVSLQCPVVEMRGEEVTLTFTVHEVQQLEIPEVDAAFLEGMGLSDAAEFDQLVSDSVSRQLIYQQRQETRSQLLEQITSSADWDLPEGLVRQQTDNALRREILEMSQAGFTREQIAARESQIRQNAVEDTRSALKQHFILDRIATDEGIEASSQEVDIELSMMAYQSGEPIRRLRARMVKSGMIENLYAQLRERKTIDHLLEKVSFEDVPHKPLVPETQTSVSGAISGRMTSSLIDDTEETEEE